MIQFYDPEMVPSRRSTHFELWFISHSGGSVDWVGWGQLWLSCVTVSATYLKIITGSWGMNQCTESQSITAEAISVGHRCWFITTCTVVWTKKSLPSGSGWLQVESVWIAVNSKAESRFTLVKPSHFLSSCPILISQSENGLNTSLTYHLAMYIMWCISGMSTSTAEDLMSFVQLLYRL